jgi:hypothetical protein
MLIHMIKKEPVMPYLRREPHLGLTGLIERELQERRFAALAAAVREHEARAAAQVVRGRPHDRALYRRLHEISAGS